ncbi:hypothetical protein [Pleionea litopenaei]|uniref:Uncharacterized protein n=1 Tax=Pleionea litopenaei TaxID=3070815 RepID=A0AA51RRR1_9GAMM|nr:hypothetical protein [Pleionea sp. HL-JVS1]WMS86294.1 hypothetical protein Q9312_13805 [Pleionea sp. HL-JVS1]
MDIPLPVELNHSSESQYWALLRLQRAVNTELMERFNAIKSKGRSVLIQQLLAKIGAIIDLLNAHGYEFVRCDFVGDIDYETSEQWYVDRVSMSHRIVLHFNGYSAQAYFQENDIEAKRDPVITLRHDYLPKSSQD